jgi:hypothetical protein
MTMARAGVAVGVAGAIALAIHGGLACFPGQVARPFRRFVPARRRDLITPVRE